MNQEVTKDAIKRWVILNHEVQNPKEYMDGRFPNAWMITIPLLSNVPNKVLVVGISLEDCYEMASLMILSDMFLMQEFLKKYNDAN